MATSNYLLFREKPQRRTTSKMTMMVTTVEPLVHFSIFTAVTDEARQDDSPSYHVNSCHGSCLTLAKTKNNPNGFFGNGKGDKPTVQVNIIKCFLSICENPITSFTLGRHFQRPLQVHASSGQRRNVEPPWERARPQGRRPSSTYGRRDWSVTRDL